MPMNFKGGIERVEDLRGFVSRMLTHEAQQREFFGAREWLLSPSLLAWCPFSVSSCFQE
jgi:hypothetical protein